MPIDPFIAATGVLLITNAVTFLWGRGHANHASAVEDEMRNYALAVKTAQSERDALQERVDVFEAEAKRVHDQRVVAARLGGAATAAIAKKKRKAAAKLTLGELANTTMRSRAKVVAPVKAARTRKLKHSGAGPAA